MSQTMIDPRGFAHTEIFTGETKRAVHEQMDARRTELERLGHTFAKRTSIGRNTACPCGSGRKFKKCCLLSGASSPPTFARVA
jgi:uncharacterized protein YecA (UPF0149 family)